jgi:membrane protein YdbS with pleckstrin-like domain
MRLSRSVYEALPYAYMLLGVAAFAVSFVWRGEVWSDLVAGFGLIVLVAGLVLVLRRRDYRIQKRRYGAAFDDDD